jgi:hypothetical protein
MEYLHDESVLKLTKVSFRGKCARTGHPLKLLSPTKLARVGHFPLASQADRLAGPVFYVHIFSLVHTLPELVGWGGGGVMVHYVPVLIIWYLPR